jgi:ABC-2 type transport system ATP-binding protein
MSDATMKAMTWFLVSVETVGTPNGHLLLRAIPHQKTMTATEVAAVLRAQNIPVDELYVERGRLDDVFRKITMPEEGDSNA